MNDIMNIRKCLLYAVTCSLHVKTGDFTCVYAVSTLCRVHANCLQSVILPEYSVYFSYFYMRNACKFSHKFKAKLPATARNEPCELRVTSTAG